MPLLYVHKNAVPPLLMDWDSEGNERSPMPVHFELGE